MEESVIIEKIHAYEKIKECTDIEQSNYIRKKLGSHTYNTSDRIIVKGYLGNSAIVYDNNEIPDGEKLVEGLKAIPAWSVDGLFNLLKAIIENELKYSQNLGKILSINTL